MANYHSCIMAVLQLIILFFVLLSASRVFAAPQNYDDDSNTNEENEIFDLPEFISTGGNRTARIGKDFRLPCQVNNLNENVVLMWSKINNESGLPSILSMGTNVLGMKSRYRVRELDNNGGNSLTIVGAEESDSGRYLCQVMVNPPKIITYNVLVGDFPETTTTTTTAAPSQEVKDDGGAAGHAMPSTALLLAVIFALRMLNFS